jgi:hydrogenase nickel incorporation protein HypA/HybF
MHELSVAAALLDLVRRRCRPDHEVREVAVAVGALTGIAPASLAFYFEGLSQGTDLEGARLVCRAVPGRIRCAGCGAEYEPGGFARVCPGCGALGGEVLSGTELDLERIEERARVRDLRV